MSLTIPPESAPSWRVVSQAPMLVANATGQYVQGYRVTAQVLNSGTTFHVDVPTAQYSASNVQSLLQTAYTEIAGVDSLEG